MTQPVLFTGSYLGSQEITGRYAGSQQNQPSPGPAPSPDLEKWSPDLEKWLELSRETEWARGLIHKLAPNARSAEWWFTEKPIDIIAGAILDREKPGPK